MPQKLLRRLAKRGSHGQSLAEFALMLPIVMLAMLIVVDFGRVLLGWINLHNTARIGADFAATHPGAWSTSPDAAAQARYQALIARDATTINCALPSPLPPPIFPDGTSVLNGRAQVDLTCSFQLLTPFVGSIVGNPLIVGASAVFPVRVGLYGVAVPPTPTPSPSPSPTPTPTPQMCTVPTILGQKVNLVAGNGGTWKKAGFDPANLTVTFGPNNYVILGENPAGTDGTSRDCNSFTLTVRSTVSP